MTILSTFSPQQEIYSIDECFLGLDGFAPEYLVEHGQKIRQAVRQSTGIPVCVGIATTKTLAKLANHCAKKELAGSEGVCDFGRLTAQELSSLFSRIPAGEVWGIGPRISVKLAEIGIETVESLRVADPDYIRHQFSVVVERTLKELNGIPCIELEEANTPRQQIMVSRSFGQPVTTLEDLSESIANFATRAAEKLRRDGSVAFSVRVHVRTNPFKEDENQYDQSKVVPLARPTDDTTRIVHAALAGLKEIYRPGCRYKKSGVLLMGLQGKDLIQPDLFDQPVGGEKSGRMMSVMDSINRKMGQGSVTVAAAGVRQSWAMRREKKSPAYTTDWDELVEAR